MSAEARETRNFWRWVHAGGIGFLALCFALKQGATHGLDGLVSVGALILAYLVDDPILRTFILGICGLAVLKWVF